MNRCTISQNLLTRVKNYYTKNESNSATRRWADKWQPQLIKGKFYKDNKQLIPISEVNNVLEKEAKEGMPLSRDGGFHYLAQKYYGFKKRDVGNFIKRLETVQLLKRMPFVNTRANKVHKKEGTAQVLLLPRFEGKGCVGIDLVTIPKQTDNFPKPTWTKMPYLYVAVVQSNNFCFAYPMVSKFAKTARACARKLWADYKERYNQEITGLIGDLGGEFKGEHRAYWKTKGITMRTVQKAWFVEKKISQLMRNIAALKDGMNYGWQYSLRTALEKTNGTYSRKIRMLPADVTGAQLRKGLVHYNRKLPRKPKQRKQPTFFIKQRCRVLTKNARDVNRVLYKSYSNFRDRKLHTWTKTVYTIKNKKKKGYTYVYEVNGKWYYPWEIQPISGKVISLEAPKQKKKTPKKVPKKKVKIAEISVSNLRRGKRVRKQTQFFGR